MTGRPDPPPPAVCVVCGWEAAWVWDDDLPLPGEPDHTPEPGYHEIDGEWWGEQFHCSRRCYLAGEGRSS